jgi:acetolactate synthase-1/2/3 large subunit
MEAAVHSNVALMHATMAIFDAWCDRAPVMVFGATGSVDAALRRRWIDWMHTPRDQGALVRDYVKWDDQPGSPEAAIGMVLRANRIMRRNPYSPVYIIFDVAM